MGKGDSRPPRRRVVRIRYGLPDGARDLPGRGTSRRPRTRGLGRRRGRAVECPADHCRRRCDAPCHSRSRTSTARAGDGLGGRGRRRRPRSDASRRLGRDARLVVRPADRVCSSRRGEHGLVRPTARDRRALASGRSLAPCRRRIRALGSGVTHAPGTRGGRRARGLMGIRCTQVAQRPLRLWRCRLRTSGRAPRCDGHHGVLSARDGRKSQHRRLDTGGIAAPAGRDGIRRLEVSRAPRG